MIKPKLIEVAPGLFSFDHLPESSPEKTALFNFELDQVLLQSLGKIDQLTEVQRISLRRAKRKLTEVLNEFSSGKRMIQVLENGDGEPIAVIIRPSDAVRLLELNKKDALTAKIRHDEELVRLFGFGELGKPQAQVTSERNRLKDITNFFSRLFLPSTEKSVT